MNPLLPAAKTLWMSAGWRCDVDPSNRLRLFHQETLVAEHRAASSEVVQTYAELWHAAIADLVEPTSRPKPRMASAGE